MRSELTLKHVFCAIFFVLMGVALRVLFQWSNAFVIDSDEAIVGLMGKHFSEGSPLPIFYYGQEYMGSAEALFVGLFLMLGVDSWLSIKIVPLLFSFLLMPLVYLLGKEIGGRNVGLISLLLCALPPAPLLVWSGKARGGFIEILCLGAIALLLTFQIQKDLKRSFPTARYFILGCVLGFGWWTNNQIIYFLLPIGLFLTLVSPSIVSFCKGLLIGCFGFFVGGLPFWIYNIQNNFGSFRALIGPGTDGWFEHLKGFFTNALPILLGAQRFWEESPLFPFANFFLYPAVIVLLSGLAFKVRTKLGREEKPERVRAGLLLLVVFTTTSVFVLSSFGYLSQAPRYLLPLYVVIFPLFALSLSNWWERRRVIALVLSVVLLSFHSVSVANVFIQPPGEPVIFNGERVSKDHRGLITFLKSENIDQVRTNYWIGYRLAYESNEEIIPVIFSEPYQVRIPSYQKQIGGEEEIPYVLTTGQAHIVSSALRTMGYAFEQVKASDYVVLYNIQAPRDTKQLELLEPIELESPLQSHELAKLFDQDLETRWGSASPQSPGMRISIHFQSPAAVRKLVLRSGKWPHDQASELRIIATVEGQKREIVSREEYAAVRYLMGGSGQDLTFLLPNISIERLEIVQLGIHPIFDWSLAEIEVWGVGELPP